MQTDQTFNPAAGWGRILSVLALLLLIVWTSVALARGATVHVSGYTRSNGTYVAPHYRSAPDGDFSNNWSTLGNINPHTGKPGTLTSPHNSSGSAYFSPPVVESPSPAQRSAPVSDPPITSTYKSGVGLPAHAQLDYTKRNWICVKGYQRVGDACAPVVLPKHAELDYLGHNWECERSFRRVDNECIPVEMPFHAKLDYLGHDWECLRGYVRQGQNCEVVQVPTFGQLDYLGHKWECRKGYRRSANSCVVVNIPENAKLDYLGHDWECSKGYQKSENKCFLVHIPPNAKLDFLGHDWECKAGFRKVAGTCLQMER